MDENAPKPETEEGLSELLDGLWGRTEAGFTEAFDLAMAALGKEATEADRVWAEKIKARGIEAGKMRDWDTLEGLGARSRGRRDFVRRRASKAFRAEITRTASDWLGGLGKAAKFLAKVYLPI